MEYGGNYITFYRSRFQLSPLFLLVAVGGGYAFGKTSGNEQILAVFVALIIFMALFFYIYYLTASPVIEVANDAVEIKEIYHPVFKWRFFYKAHTFTFASISRIEIKLNDLKQPQTLKIQFFDGRAVKTVFLRKSDIVRFDSFIRLLIDKSPQGVSEVTN